MFFVQHQCFWFQKTKLKNTNFWSKEGLQQNVLFFMNLCFAKREKLSSFLPIVCPILVDVQKHYKNWYFSTFVKAKKQNKYHFEVLLSGPSRCYHLGQADCNFKMANLAQIITPQICARNKKSVETPIL